MGPILVTPIPSNGWTLACLRARVFNHCAPCLSSPSAPEDFPSDILWLQVQPAQLKGPPVRRQRWGWGRTEPPALLRATASSLVPSLDRHVPLLCWLFRGVVDKALFSQKH